MKRIIECRLIGNLMHLVHIAASLSLSLSLSLPISHRRVIVYVMCMVMGLCMGTCQEQQSCEVFIGIVMCTICLQKSQSCFSFLFHLGTTPEFKSAILVPTCHSLHALLATYFVFFFFSNFDIIFFPIFLFWGLLNFKGVGINIIIKVIPVMKFMEK